MKYPMTLAAAAALMTALAAPAWTAESQQALAGDGALAIEAPMPHYDHILVIIAENQSFNRMMTGSETPNLQRLANTYNLATGFYAETHPSEGNYIAIVGGSTFGVHDDDAWYCKPGSTERYCDKSTTTAYADHTIRGRSLVDQLEERGLTWKGYFQDIPAPGTDEVRWPDPDNPPAGQPGGLYVVKHNGFMNFARVQADPQRKTKIVGFDQLERDLDAGAIPNYAHIVPNQCDNMHGITGPHVPPDCTKTNDAGLIPRGDAMIGRLVERITRAAFWSAPANSAIVITFDEDGKPRDPAERQGCCGVEPGSPANFGGGHIPTIVITNHGRHGIVDPTPYNHYSLLRSTEQAFGIDEYLNQAANTQAGVRSMAPLFAVAR